MRSGAEDGIRIERGDSVCYGVCVDGLQDVPVVSVIDGTVNKVRLERRTESRRECAS